jgi:hypothetical protein
MCFENILKDFIVGSQYKFDEFVSDCSIGISKAFVTSGAMITASSDFNLKTRQAVLEFIGNGG